MIAPERIAVCAPYHKIHRLERVLDKDFSSLYHRPLISSPKNLSERIINSQSRNHNVEFEFLDEKFFTKNLQRISRLVDPNLQTPFTKTDTIKFHMMRSNGISKKKLFDSLSRSDPNSALPEIYERYSYFLATNNLFLQDIDSTLVGRLILTTLNEQIRDDPSNLGSSLEFSHLFKHFDYLVIDDFESFSLSGALFLTQLIKHQQMHPEKGFLVTVSPEKLFNRVLDYEFDPLRLLKLDEIDPFLLLNQGSLGQKAAAATPMIGEQVHWITTSECLHPTASISRFADAFKPQTVSEGDLADPDTKQREQGSLSQINNDETNLQVFENEKEEIEKFLSDLSQAIETFGAGKVAIGYIGMSCFEKISNLLSSKIHLLEHDGDNLSATIVSFLFNFIKAVEKPDDVAPIFTLLSSKFYPLSKVEKQMLLSCSLFSSESISEILSFVSSSSSDGVSSVDQPKQKGERSNEKLLTRNPQILESDLQRLLSEEAKDSIRRLLQDLDHFQEQLFLKNPAGLLKEIATKFNFVNTLRFLEFGEVEEGHENEAAFAKAFNSLSYSDSNKSQLQQFFSKNIKILLRQYSSQNSTSQEKVVANAAPKSAKSLAPSVRLINLGAVLQSSEELQYDALFVPFLSAKHYPGRLFTGRLSFLDQKVRQQTFRDNCRKCLRFAILLAQKKVFLSTSNDEKLSPIISGLVEKEPLKKKEHQLAEKAELKINTQFKNTPNARPSDIFPDPSISIKGGIRINTLSWSKICALSQCSLKFGITYSVNSSSVEQHKNHQTSLSERSKAGIALHHIVKEVVEAKIQGRKISSGEAWKDYREKLKTLYDDSGQQETQPSAPVEMIQEIVSREEASTSQPLIVESNMSIALSEEIFGRKLYLIVGCDRVDISPCQTQLTIREFKSSTIGLERSAFKENTQIALYYYGLSKMFPDKQIKMEVEAINSGRKIQLFPPQDWKERIEKVLQGAVEVCKSPDLFAKPNPSTCWECQYRKKCPASLAIPKVARN